MSVFELEIHWFKDYAYLKFDKLNNSLFSYICNISTDINNFLLPFKEML